MQVSSELEERRQHVFRQVKPCCVSLLEWLPDPSPSSQNDLILKLDALLQCLNTIENPQTILHESLLQYISFPLLQTFTKGCLNSDKAITLVLDCLGYLVDNCFQNMGLELQVRIFLIILEFLSEKNETQSKTLGITNVISEELKLQSAKMQAPFFFNKSGRKQSGNTSAFSGFFLCTEQEFSQRRIQLIVARSVHTFVYCIKTEKLLDLRLAVLRNFNQLISDLQNTQILAQFFPGIVTGLSSIVMDNVDRGHSRLLASLLSALEKAIVGTLNDDVNSAYITRITSLNQLDGYFNSKVEAIENTTEYTPESKPDENIESFRKNSSWITAALTQTKALLIKVLRIRSHLDWKVRNACLKLCFNTISHCHKLLNSCFSILIETLVLGLKDTYPEVVTTAKEYLEILLHDPELARLILAHCKQNFYNLIDSLPGTLTRHDELVKYNALSLCAVYLQLINQDIDEFLSTNFNDFVSSLILSLELDDSDIQLLETRVIGAYDVRNNPESTSQIDAWSWIPNFKSISEDRTLNQLSLMFRTFGYYGNIVSMMDKLSSHLRSSKGTKDEVVYVFIINELLKGASEHINNDVDSDLQFQNLSINTIYTPRDDDLEHKDRVKITKSIAKVVLREYLSRWNDDTVESNPHYSQPSNKTTSEDNSSLFDPKSTRTSSITQGTVHYSARIQEILTIKSIFYGTACIARILGRDFRLELLNVLYPLMEMMGHESVVIYNSAACCAESIRVCCQYESVHNMIAENADYLVNAMSHKFTFSLTHSQVSQVLQAFLCILGTDALPLIEDITDDILDTLDNNRNHYDICSQLLGALDDFLGLTLEVIKSNRCVDEIADHPQKIVDTPTQFDNFLTWYNAKADESDLLLETLYTSPQTPQTTKDKENVSEDKSDESRVSMMITQKSIIYLSAHTSKMRSLAISIFGKGLKIVDKSSVYSLINDAWPSLYHLLESKESFLVFKVVRLIQEISNEHADFVSKRFVSQIWPYFARYLTSSRSQPLAKRSHSAERSFHPDHHDSQKLLTAILEATSSMLLHLNIPIQQVRSICEIVAPFASDESDSQVQEAISQVFISVARRFPDVLWVFLNIGCAEEVFDPPSSQLNPVVFPTMYGKSMQHICNSLRYLLEDEQR